MAQSSKLECTQTERSGGPESLLAAPGTEGSSHLGVHVPQPRVWYSG